MKNLKDVKNDNNILVAGRFSSRWDYETIKGQQSRNKEFPTFMYISPNNDNTASGWRFDTRFHIEIPLNIRYDNPNFSKEIRVTNSRNQAIFNTAKVINFISRY